MNRPCPEQFLRSPAAPDLTMWPYDTPWIMKQMRDMDLEVHNTGMIDRMQAALDDMTERCRTAESRAFRAGQEDVCLEILRYDPSFAWQIAKEYLSRIPGHEADAKSGFHDNFRDSLPVSVIDRNINR